MLWDLERLRALGLFPDRLQRRFLKACRVTVEETRAWANFELVEMLHAREERDWARFGRLRQRREKALEDASDVVLPAKPRRRKSRKGRRVDLEFEILKMEYRWCRGFQRWRGQARDGSQS